MKYIETGYSGLSANGGILSGFGKMLSVNDQSRFNLA